MADMINWGKLNKEDVKTINRIAKRAAVAFPQINFMDLTMDISAVHITTPLDLNKFESFEDFDFFHDVLGIAKHIDRSNGDLRDCFLPRCSA